MNLPDFGSTERCPKCEYPQQTVEWVPRFVRLLDGVVLEVDGNVGGVEAMVNRCGGCGYQWAEKPADLFPAIYEPDSSLVETVACFLHDNHSGCSSVHASAWTNCREWGYHAEAWRTEARELLTIMQKEGIVR